MARSRITDAVGADDAGSAVVEFVLAGMLLVMLALGVLQLGLVLHVRNALIAAAGEGAMAAARADATLSDGVGRTAALVAASLGNDYDVEVRAALDESGSAPVVVVTVVAPLPVAGLLGPSGVLEVMGRAPLEIVG